MGKPVNESPSRNENTSVRITLPSHLLVKLHSVKLLDGTTISDVVENAVRKHLGSRVREYGERAGVAAMSGADA